MFPSQKNFAVRVLKRMAMTQQSLACCRFVIGTKKQKWPILGVQTQLSLSTFIHVVIGTPIRTWPVIRRVFHPNFRVSTSISSKNFEWVRVFFRVYSSIWSSIGGGGGGVKKLLVHLHSLNFHTNNATSNINGFKQNCIHFQKDECLESIAA